MDPTMHSMRKEKIMDDSKIKNLNNIKFKAAFASGSNGNLSFATPLIRNQHDDGTMCYGMDPEIVIQLVERIEYLESLMLSMYRAMSEENKGFTKYAEKYIPNK